MDSLNTTAVAALEQAVFDLLDLQNPPVLRVLPSKVATSGLGGFVGLHADPVGEVYERRVEGSVVIEVSAASLNDLNAEITQLTKRLMTLDRATLVGKGFQRLVLDRFSALRESPGSFFQEIWFDVRFEYLAVPQEAGDVIDRIPVAVEQAAVTENFELSA